MLNVTIDGETSPEDNIVTSRAKGLARSRYIKQTYNLRYGKKISEGFDSYRDCFYEYQSYLGN